MEPAAAPLHAANQPTTRTPRRGLALVVEGALAPEVQEQAVRAFATLATTLLMDEPSEPMDKESVAPVDPQQQDIPPTQARSSA